MADHPITHPAVAAWMEGLSPSQRAVVLDVRGLILDAAPQLKEDIKWKNTLVFSTRKNLIQTVVSKAGATFIFLEGVGLDDPTGLLEGDGKKARSVRVAGPDFDRAALADLVRRAAAAHP